MNNEDTIFKSSVEEVQLEAERMMNRRLTDHELYYVRKGIAWGLLNDIDVIVKDAIETAVNECSNRTD